MIRTMPSIRGLAPCGVLLSASILAIGAAHAQDADETVSEVVDEIVVQGIRGSIQESLEVKRNTDVVSDALIGVEIGDLPDLSIAESLERITGVTSDRFKGGASEVSIRGLGDFLGYSTLNGRELTSGSDGRGVNFGQFPSELFQGAVVYKSQQASFVEGGTAGTISLQTLRPLDYNRRRIQLNGLIGYSDYEDRVVDGDPYSERLTASYVDQFDLGFGEFGVAIGGQIRRDTAPEDIYTSSSTFRPCNTIGGGNCSLDLEDPEAGPVYFTSNQYIYRAMATEADRDSIMANVQWRPADAWDVNADFQWSDRTDIEDRANLVIADGRRGIDPIAISEASGALLAWEGETRIENQSVYRPRLEEYLGGGLDISYEPTDLLTLTVDVGYSNTERTQDELDMRIRIDPRVEYELDTRGLLIPALTFTDVSAVEDAFGMPFDLDDHDFYQNGARARRRQEVIDDESFAVRFDGQYVLQSDFLSSLEAGVRWGKRQRVHDDAIDVTFEGDGLVNDYTDPAVVAARRNGFIVDNLYEGASTPTQGLTFATWEPEQLFVALTGSRDAGTTLDGLTAEQLAYFRAAGNEEELAILNGNSLNTADADVTEETWAGYVQANLATVLGDTPVNGNVGLRIVHTDVESVGVTRDLVAVEDPANPGTVFLAAVGDPTATTETNDFVNILPSANLIFELSESQLLRFAGYRSLSRPDMEAMSAALSINDDEDGFSLDALEGNIEANGNPFLEPLTAWNADVSYEWYYSDDTAISVAAYYKYLETGFEIETSQATINVDGADRTVAINRRANSDEGEDLYGAELTVQHVFSNLPAPLDGFGIRGGINWAETTFEFPDPTQQEGVDLADLTKPLSIEGYSRFSGNVTVFWENDDVSLRLAYKGRSSYNKPFRVSANRSADAQDFLDFSASYDLTDNIELRFQGLNLLDQPNVLRRPVRDSLAEANFSGRRFFVGARAKF